MDKVLPIIIIDYLSAERTRQYIEDCLREMTGAELTFIVVDNSCNEENFNALLSGREVIEHQFSECLAYEDKKGKCLFIKSNENAGFARGNNLGFDVARQIYDFDYMLFSNNDIQLEKFDIRSLVSIFESNPDIAVVGPRIIGLDGKDQSPYYYHHIFARWWKMNLLYPFDVISRKKKVKEGNINSIDIIPKCKSGLVYRVLGAFMLCDAKKFEQAGEFDEHTFLYAEEPILTERLISCGYKTYYYRESEVIHEGGYTTKKIDSDTISKMRKRLDSELYYYENYRGVKQIYIRWTRRIFDFYAFKFRLVGKLKRR